MQVLLRGLALLLVLALLSCSQQVSAKHYDLSGKIVSVDRNAHQLTIQHEDIPGLMKGMTMPFRVNDEWVFNAAQPGDTVSASLVIANGSSHLENIVLTHASPDSASTSSVRLPQVGDTVPDFHFVNQDGKKLSFAQLRGKAVLLTFIYTRCPLPDYCIRMSQNFGEVARTLKAQPDLYARTQQISISFDPAYDTPKVLREYGSNYAGEVDPAFLHWQFVTAAKAEIKRAADFFGLSYTPDGGQIVHSLRTAVVGPDGKIVKLFNGNDWKPNEAVEAMASSLH